MININNVILVGRLTKDVELRKTQFNTSVCNFTLAVNRKLKNENGEYDADFISCVAWRQSAEFLSQYSSKGDMVSVEGSIQTRNYEGQNGRVYVTEIVADSVQLIHKQDEQKQPKNESYWQGTLDGRPDAEYYRTFKRNEVPTEIDTDDNVPWE